MVTPIPNSLRRDFQRFLAAGGYCTPLGRAACALAHAKLLSEWRARETAGLVRLVVKPEDENYFDVYGEPDTAKEREAIERELERHGCHYVESQYWTGERWAPADGIGMCVYANPANPFENCYVPQLMAEAIEHVSQCGDH